MIKKIPREIRFDDEGTRWVVDKQRSTWYPTGGINKLTFKNCLNQTTFVRYDEAGCPIGGNLSLA